MHAVLDCEAWAAYWPCANSRLESVTIQPSLARVYNVGVVTTPLGVAASSPRQRRGDITTPNPYKPR